MAAPAPEPTSRGAVPVRAASAAGAPKSLPEPALRAGPQRRAARAVAAPGVRDRAAQVADRPGAAHCVARGCRPSRTPEAHAPNSRARKAAARLRPPPRRAAGPPLRSSRRWISNCSCTPATRRSKLTPARLRNRRAACNPQARGGGPSGSSGGIMRYHMVGCGICRRRRYGLKRSAGAIRNARPGL